jgi:hypothetical protein
MVLEREKDGQLPLTVGVVICHVLDVSNGAVVRWLRGLFTMMTKAASQLYVCVCGIAVCLPARYRAHRASAIVRLIS